MISSLLEVSLQGIPVASVNLVLGGTAGMVLANRLSEVPDFRVLVLEAGPEPTVVRNYESPGGNQYLGGTAIDWNFYTTPQEHIDNRVLFYRRTFENLEASLLLTRTRR